MTTVGILHPGSMGAAVGAQLTARGHRVLWVPDGRSEVTQARACAAGFEGARLAALLQAAEVVICLCPPANAEEIARRATSYRGTWLEANAISPMKARSIAGILTHATLVDGAVIGSPPRRRKETTLYVSAPEEAANAIGSLFSGSLVNVRPVGHDIGYASALKMAYTLHQKASRALAAIAYALAAEHGVEADLIEIAKKRSGSYLAEIEYIPKTASRAWRWSPEMREVAETLMESRLPDDLAQATAAIFDYWPRPTGEIEYGMDEALTMLRILGATGDSEAPDQ